MRELGGDRYYSTWAAHIAWSVAWSVVKKRALCSGLKEPQAAPGKSLPLPGVPEVLLLNSLPGKPLWTPLAALGVPHCAPTASGLLSIRALLHLYCLSVCTSLCLPPEPADPLKAGARLPFPQIPGGIGSCHCPGSS